MAVLSARDAGAWDALAARVARGLEPRLDPMVLANRTPTRGRRWRLRPLLPALGVARRRARHLAAGAPVLVRTDVERFYPSVAPDRLYRALVRAGTPHRDAGTAADMLDGWGSEGYEGLPIGPPGSAVLANALLAEADAALRPAPFLRWVDDFLIAAGSDRHAALLLERLDDALEGVGLVRSWPKTGVVEGGASLRWPGHASTLCP